MDAYLKGERMEELCVKNAKLKVKALQPELRGG